MESLSSHSSERNSSAKAGPPRSAATARPPDDGSLWGGAPHSAATAASSCISSPESSSREDAGRTDGESEDALSLSSLGGALLAPPPRSSQAPEKAPHSHIDLRLPPVNRSAAPSLKSLQRSEGHGSCSGSVQSLSTLEAKENPDLPPKQVLRRRVDSAVSNGYQRPGSVVAARALLFESGASPPTQPAPVGRDARAMYSCEAEHSHELSFPQGALFSNVYSSVEPGWLQATYEGRTGLIPENYVVFL